MNQNAGLSVGIVALLALLAHLAIPVGRENGSAGQAGAGANATNGQTPGPAATPPPAGPWIATRHFFAPDAPPVSVDDSKSQNADLTNPAGIQQYFGLPDSGGVECLLATVPDPSHTRLPLFADHSIEAIQRGAAEARWEFATQWLPWSGATGAGTGDSAKSAQDQQPGVLVFRHAAPQHAAPGKGWPPGALLVFVAGESPTAGVNPRQFQIARAYMRALCPSPGAKILGPTFSGSFHSLARLIVQDQAARAPHRYAYQVESGTAQSPGDIRAFQAAAGPDVQFHSATEDLTSQYKHLHDLRRELRIPASQVALLAEDESAFGDAAAEPQSRAPGAKPDAGDAFRVFRFPREISHLRDAYRKAVQAAQPQAAPAANPDFSLTDPNAGEDSIPTYSQTQTPLSQNGVINEITRAIERADIRIVFVSATNVLDELFLAGVLRRQCPDTRVVVQNADLLFVQAEQTQPLAGSLFLASYPLFAESGLWKDRSQLDIFPDTLSEGVFHATVSLLTGEAREPGGPKPPAWLLTLDRRGFLPVRLWPAGTRSPAPGRMASPQSLNILATAFALFSAAIGVWIFLLHWNPNWQVDARFDPTVDEADQPPVKDKECPPPGNPALQESFRGLYLFLFLLILIGIQGAICLVRLANDWAHPIDDWPWLMLMLPGCVVPSIAVGMGCRPRRIGKAGRVAICLAASAVGLAAVAGALWFLCCRGEGTGSSFSFRAAEMRFGSSPLLPIVAAAAALLLWCVVHATRLHFATCDEPGIAPGADCLLHGRLDVLHDRFNKSAHAALDLPFVHLRGQNPSFRFGPGWIVPLVLCCLVGLYCLFRVHVQLASIDGTTYDLICIPLQLLVAGLLLLTCWQIVALWRSLHGFTTSLETLPLTRAFIPVSPAGANRPIWVRRFKLQSLDIYKHCALILHDMELLPAQTTHHSPAIDDVKKWHERYRKGIAAAIKIDPAESREQLTAARRDLSCAGKDVAGVLWQTLLAAWKSAPLVGKLDGAPSPVEAGSGAKASDAARKEADAGAKKPTTEETGHAAAPNHPQPLNIPGDPQNVADLAETFVALHYSLFLLYGMRQIQNLLWFPSIGFVLLMFSMNSYSFQAPQWIGRFLLILIAAIALILGSCLLEMERNPILSRIAGTNPGELNAPFYVKLARYGALPIFGLLASLFPSISNVLFSWMQPALEALK